MIQVLRLDLVYILLNLSIFKSDASWRVYHFLLTTRDLVDQALDSKATSLGEKVNPVLTIVI